MKTRSPCGLMAIVLTLTLASECQRHGDFEAVDVHPLNDILAAGRAPVEMGSAVPEPVSLGAPAFKVTVKNVTDAPLDSILWTVVAFDRAGNLLPEGETEGGYTDTTNPIAAGERAELSFTVLIPEAVRVKLVLKEVVIVALNPLDHSAPGLPQKWRNPFYDAELRTARGIFVPE